VYVLQSSQRGTDRRQKVIGSPLCQGERVPSHSDAERKALADALAQAGPDAPTLCTGWTTTDLAAHLVTREHRLDTGPGIILPSGTPFGRWTERVQAQYARKPFDQLVARFAEGPSRLSWARLPGVDARVNLLEHLVHCEDVRRAQPGWEPRDLPAERQRAIWRSITQTGRMLLRRSPVPVRFTTPDGDTHQVISRPSAGGSGQGIDIIGAPAELAFYTFGRREHARVELAGPAASRELFERVDLAF